jgi:hypothetical protein
MKESVFRLARNGTLRHRNVGDASRTYAPTHALTSDL